MFLKNHSSWWVASMLVTVLGDKNVLATTIKCWSRFGHFRRQHPPSCYISVGHQHSKDATNIKFQSPTLSHQHHDVTNIAVISWCNFIQKRQFNVRIDLHYLLKSGHFRIWSVIEASLELLSFVRQDFLSELTFKMSWKDIQSSLKERCWPFWNLEGSKLS